MSVVCLAAARHRRNCRQARQAMSSGASFATAINRFGRRAAFEARAEAWEAAGAPPKDTEGYEVWLEVQGEGWE